jgi:hypothetical protein
MELAASTTPSPAIGVDASCTQHAAGDILLTLAHDQEVTRRRRDPYRRNLSLGQAGLQDETDLRPPPNQYHLRFARTSFKPVIATCCWSYAFSTANCAYDLLQV